jgi:hypothetical protein
MRDRRVRTVTVAAPFAHQLVPVFETCQCQRVEEEEEEEEEIRSHAKH